MIRWLNIGQGQREGGLTIDIAVGSVGFLFLPLECRGTGNGGIEVHVLSGQGIHRSRRGNDCRQGRQFQGVQLRHFTCAQGPVVDANVVQFASEPVDVFCSNNKTTVAPSKFVSPHCI